MDQDPPTGAEPAKPPSTHPSPAAEGAPVDAAAHDPRWTWGLLAGLALMLAFGIWGVVTVLGGGGEGPRARTADLQARIDALEQRATTLARSDEVSRSANRELQGLLAEREEEIAGLRADVAFYERFVGATAQRRGLSVHELRLEPGGGGAWHFTATLTQNLDRDKVSDGRLLLMVEGTRDGKLQELAWSDLRQRKDAPGVEYSFKYFQQVKGDIVLPEGFAPVRVEVSLERGEGDPLTQSFTWADVTGRSGNGA